MSTATLNGKPIERCELHVPAWGIPHADVVVNDGAALSGAVTLILADLTVSCFVVANRGGVYRDRGSYRLVAGAGAGGWSTRIRAQHYRNDAGIKTSKVIGDAATLAGEKLGALATDPSLGVSFVRPAGPAALALQLVSERAWHVELDGTTHLGARASSPMTDDYTIDDEIPGRARLTVAAEQLSQLVPGVQIEGFTAGLVVHVLTKDTLRTIVWGVP